MLLKFYTNRNIFGTIWWVFCLDIYIKNKAKAISAKLLEINFGQIQWYFGQIQFFFCKYSGILGKYSSILGKYRGILRK